MPDFETMDRNQKAVLWKAKDETFDTFGQPKVEAPIEIEVRWVWKSKLMSGADGKPVTVDATVVVGDISIPVGSVMWEGELADWYGTGSQFGDDAVMEVIASNYTEDLKGMFVRRTVGVAFSKDVLPNLA